MSFETVCRSMYSLMSRRIMDSSVPKNVEANVLHSAVLPTPVGPQNMKPAIGRSGFRSPARARRKARETLLTASSWPTMVSWSSASRRMSRADSVAPTCSTAMPVQPATTEATSSAVTLRFSRPAGWAAPAFVSWPTTSSSLAFSSWASSKRSATTASRICARSATSSSRRPAVAVCPFGAFCRSSKRSASSSSRTLSCCASSYFSTATADFFAALTSSSSLLTAQRSLADSLSSESWKICWRTLEPASSITSMALSGR
mmetsp:Transcript_149167/g.362278  ORF Transcript_149167/g.362278 Transcript_149167/m.362278 type:complete len:259 (-) Transcript_149167:1536-2312(-)